MSGPEGTRRRLQLARRSQEEVQGWSASAPTPLGDATLRLPDGEEIPLPAFRDASGARFVDVRSLYGKTGVCTFDPGFMSTGACRSTITFIDGKAGRLLYRGYDVLDLAQQGDWIDSCFLLLYGNLPSLHERGVFRHRIETNMLVHVSLTKFFEGFKRDAHPMAIMVGVVGALSAFFPFDDIWNPRLRDDACINLIAKVPTLAAMAYKHSIGEPCVYPKKGLSYAANLLYMLHAVPTEPFVLDPVLARALEKIIVLHMDHEQNASTSTVRSAGSSQANPYACIAAGIATLWGPAHGGANEAVLKMLIEIGTPDRIPEYVARAKDRDDPFRLMGFGHRVYKTYDPRARAMQDVCREVLGHLQLKDPLLDVAIELERIATNDEYFVARNLYPNVDFYSGIVLRALGIPMSMYTVLFAVSRTVGWVAQWKEMAEELPPKISRPRQAFQGHMDRTFTPSGEGRLSKSPAATPPDVELAVLERKKQQHRDIELQEVSMDFASVHVAQ
ncbi:unnamed protein product [Pedinophyceae sp. YPF-701]|nr:unnamed protein product [Pedinophyceae sp. YPF-701]